MSRCLPRETVLLVASGQCPAEQLPDVGRHLQGCEKCRAAVAGLASGARLGDTAPDAPAVVAPSPSRWALKSAPVVASLLAVVGAVLVGVPQEAPALPTAPQAAQPIVFTVVVPAQQQSVSTPAPAVEKAPAPATTRVEAEPCPPAPPTNQVPRVRIVEKPPAVAVLNSTDERLARVDGRYIRTQL